MLPIESNKPTNQTINFWFGEDVVYTIFEANAHPDPYIRERGWSPKKFFPPFVTQFGLKLKGRWAPWAPLLDQPLYSTIILLIISEPVC